MQYLAKHKAFTLIELLVVIAIISLLVSILLPSLQKGKQLAQSTVCMTTLHNLYLSFTMYANDSNEVVVPARVGDPEGTYYIDIWRDLLFPYVGETKEAYRCPADDQFCPTEEPWCKYFGWKPTLLHRFYSILSYGYNVWNVGKFKDQKVSGWCHEYHHLSEIDKPSETFVFADSFGRAIPERLPLYPNWKYCPQIIPKWTYLIDPIHIGRANLVYLDGSVNPLESPNESKTEFRVGDIEGLR